MDHFLPQIVVDDDTAVALQLVGLIGVVFGFELIHEDSLKQTAEQNVCGWAGEQNAEHRAQNTEHRAQNTKMEHI